MTNARIVDATHSSNGWLKPDFESILAELKEVPNWVLAKAVWRDGQPAKVPFQPSGEVASSTDPKTWSTFEGVQRAFDSSLYIGVGFVLDGRPHFDGKYLHGFDWDRCIADGRVDPEVKARVKELGISRVEVSVSATGLRGFFLHHEPLPSRRSKVDGRSVELYSNARYMITTGRAVKGCEALV